MGIPFFPGRTSEFGRLSFRCPACSDKHFGLPALGSGLPDAIFALSAGGRERRAMISSDLCVLDDRRFFIRCQMSVPIIGYLDSFSFGPWLEVDSQTFDSYYEHFYYEHCDKDTGPGWRSAPATMANALPGYVPKTLGLACVLQLDDDLENRPGVVAGSDNHPLWTEQAQGMSLDRAKALMSNLRGYELLLD